MSFLWLAGYYRRFVSNFSEVAAPLSNLLRKNAVLTNYPVLCAPNFNWQFKLAVDTSDLGVGAALLQEDEEGIEHPCAYFSKKLNNYQRNYATIEKETLSLILALSQF